MDTRGRSSRDSSIVVDRVKNRVLTTVCRVVLTLFISDSTSYKSQLYPIFIICFLFLCHRPCHHPPGLVLLLTINLVASITVVPWSTHECSFQTSSSLNAVFALGGGPSSSTHGHVQVHTYSLSPAIVRASCSLNFHVIPEPL